MFKQRVLAVAILLAAGVAMVGTSSIGQENEKKVKGRLPAYYPDLVTEQQRTAIYTIQAKYQSKITALNEELLSLTKQQSAEIENVLTSEQKKLLKMAQEGGAAKKKKNAADKAEKTAEEAAPTEANKAIKTVKAGKD